MYLAINQDNLNMGLKFRPLTIFFFKCLNILVKISLKLIGYSAISVDQVISKTYRY